MTQKALVATALAALLCVSAAPARAQDDAPPPDQPAGDQTPQPSDRMSTDAGGSRIGATQATPMGGTGSVRWRPKEKKKKTGKGKEKGRDPASDDPGDGSGDDGSSAGSSGGSSDSSAMPGQSGGGGFVPAATAAGASWAPPEGASDACPNGPSRSPAHMKPPKFKLASMVVENSPADVVNYAVTTDVTRLDVTSDGFRIDFTKKDGEGRWPDITTPGWGGPLQYSLWLVEAIDGVWYASGPIEFWYGEERSGGSPSQVYQNWFYARDRWGPMACHQPRVGERVGFFVTHGDARNNGNGSRPLKERSNIVWVEYPGSQGGVYSF